MVTRRRKRANEEPNELDAVAWNRIRQRYTCLRGRGIVLGFTSIGITVKAAMPEELEGMMTVQAIVAVTKGEPQN